MSDEDRIRRLLNHQQMNHWSIRISDSNKNEIVIDQSYNVDMHGVVEDCNAILQNVIDGKVFAPLRGSFVDYDVEYTNNAPMHGIGQRLTAMKEHFEKYFIR
jgi:hypothetical protein